MLLCATHKILKKMVDYRLFSPPGVVAMGNTLSSQMSRPNLFKYFSQQFVSDLEEVNFFLSLSCLQRLTQPFNCKS